ncbi:MAG: hypothetical protein EZS28_023790 [Streblomastix strix]|uniref:Cyclin N-terminal domain-containing protein n=1 Tax=Streblomastix strix TaxID=222440 RepID=A0A5J4VDZ3_9EUKA|nr:MAG: hypothetical protein EZS28_023790 [Streblomastix strix]
MLKTSLQITMVSPVFEDEPVSQNIINFSAFCLCRALAITHQSQLQLMGQHVQPFDQEQTWHSIIFLLQRLQKLVVLRTSELLQALALIDTISNSSTKFHIIPQNIQMILLVCILLAHKVNCDKPYSNGWWSRAFGLPVQVLNDTEILILNLLQFNVYVPSEMYDRYNVAIAMKLQEQEQEKDSIVLIEQQGN